MSDVLSRPEKDAAAIFAGRIDVLYALGRHYLSLPFAVLWVPATVIAGHAPSVLPLMPLLLQITVVMLCGLIAALEGFDAQAIGYVAPSLSAAWHLHPGIACAAAILAFAWHARLTPPR